MHKPAVMRARAEELLTACREAGREASHDTLQGLAREMYASDTPYIEREEIVSQALDLYVAKSRGEQMPKELTTGEAKIITRAFLSKNRDANAQDAWAHLKTQGTPGMKASSFATMVVTPVRKELGIARPGRRKKAGAKASTNGKGAFGKGRRKAAASTDAPAADPAPERSSSEAQVGLASTLTEAAERGAGRHAADDRDQIVLETPGGRLTARHESADAWLVEFRGLVPAEVVHLLVADLVGPFTGSGVNGR